MKNGLLKVVYTLVLLGAAFWWGLRFGALLAQVYVGPSWNNVWLETLFESTFLILLHLPLYLLVVLLHEFGHLLGGLWSGYHFVSFRVGNRVLVRWDEGLVWKRFSLMGTGGQCIMAPPVRSDDQFPFLRYYLGGPLMNLLLSLVFFLALEMQPSVWTLLLWSFGELNLLSALANGIPWKGKVVANDGWNAWNLSKNPAAREVFAKQMLILEAMTRGQQLRALPADWFRIESESRSENSSAASLAFTRAQYMIDKGEEQAGIDLLQRLLESKSSVPSFERIMMQLFKLYYDLLTEAASVDLSVLDDKETQQFLKGMKDYPFVLSLNYALARLSKQDQVEAARIRQRLDRVLETYPTKAEIDSVWEDLELIDRIAAGQPLD